jgi:hypothetical protein
MTGPALQALERVGMYFVCSGKCGTWPCLCIPFPSVTSAQIDNIFTKLDMNVALWDAGYMLFYFHSLLSVMPIRHLCRPVSVKALTQFT